MLETRCHKMRVDWIPNAGRVCVFFDSACCKRRNMVSASIVDLIEVIKNQTKHSLVYARKTERTSKFLSGVVSSDPEVGLRMKKQGERYK